MLFIRSIASVMVLAAIAGSCDAPPFRHEGGRQSSLPNSELRKFVGQNIACLKAELGPPLATRVSSSGMFECVWVFHKYVYWENRYQDPRYSVPMWESDEIVIKYDKDGTIVEIVKGG